MTRGGATRSRGSASCVRSAGLHLVQRLNVTCATRAAVLSCSDRRRSRAKEEYNRANSWAHFSSPLALTGPSKKDEHGLKPSTPKKGLDGRGLQLNPTTCGYILAKPLLPDIHPLEAPSGRKVRHNKCFALRGAAFRPPDFRLRKLQEQLDRADRLMTQISSPFASA